MSVNYNKQTLGAGFNSAAQLQSAEDETSASFEDCLSLTGSGTGSNVLEVDLDLNDKDLLNVNSLNANEIYINGSLVTSNSLSTSTTTISGNGTATSSQTVITLSTITYTPSSKNMSLYINGVRQVFSAYVESSATIITLTSGMTTGDIYEVVVTDYEVTSDVRASTADMTANYIWTGIQDFTGATVSGVTFDFANITEVLADTPITGDVMTYNGSAWVLEAINIGEAANYTWTGTHDFTGAVVTGLANSLNDLTDVTFSAAPNLGINEDFGAITTGLTNIVISVDLTGQALTSGNSNLFIGSDVATALTTGSNNVVMGRRAMENSVAPDNCFAIGFNTLPVCEGNENTMGGYSSGTLVSSGTGNTAFGNNNLKDVTTGNNNLAYGELCDAGSATAENRIMIGHNVDGTADNQFSFGSQSNVVSNDFGTDALWSRASDIRKKKNIEDDSLGLSFINNLKPVTFTWRPIEGKENDTTTVIHGLIAQEVEKALLTEGCSTFNGHVIREDGFQELKLEAFITPLINAVKELTARVQELEAKS